MECWNFSLSQSSGFCAGRPHSEGALAEERPGRQWLQPGVGAGPPPRKTKRSRASQSICARLLLKKQDLSLSFSFESVEVVFSLDGLVNSNSARFIRIICTCVRLMG